MAPFSAWKEVDDNMKSMMATKKENIEAQSKENFSTYVPLCFRDKTVDLRHYEVKVYINTDKMILVKLKQSVKNPADVTLTDVENFGLPPYDD